MASAPVCIGMDADLQPLIDALVKEDFAEAAKKARTLTLTLRREGPPDPLLAMMLELAVAYAKGRDGDPDASRASLGRAERIEARPCGDLVDQWENAAVVCLVNGDYERALGWLDRARELIGRRASGMPIDVLLTHLVHRSITLTLLRRPEDAAPDVALARDLNRWLHGEYGPWVREIAALETGVPVHATFRVGRVRIATPVG